MQKKYLFKKKFNKLFVSITKGIESFFNFFRENFFYKKSFSKSVKTIDKKLFLIIAIIFVSIISYFSIPAFYEKNKIKNQIEKQIFTRYNLKVNLDKNFKYGLFPKPHFSFKNTILKYDSKDIANSKNLKVYISSKNLLSANKLNILNLVFNKTDFKIMSSDFHFFVNLLNKNKSEENIYFFNNNFFYLDQNMDVIFLTNLKKLNYLYDDILFQKLSSKLDIFNIPFSLDVQHNAIEKKFFTEIQSYPLRLNIKNNSNYYDNKLGGELDLKMINKNLKIDYNLENDLLKFISKNETIKGEINIKPFFVSLNLDLFHIDLKKIFEENSLLINILKSEILNNENLNGNINIKSNNFKSVNFFEEIKFNILLEEGQIFIQNFTTNFKDSVLINLVDTELIVIDNKLKFAGYITLDFVDVKKFFEHYQINIKDRKYIKKINLGFLFHLDDEFIEIDNLKIDGYSNKKLEKFLLSFNSNKENIFNKILIRNSVKSFFKIISSD